MSMRAVVALTRPQRLPAVWSAALAGVCLAPVPWDPAGALGAAAALTLAFAGLAILNDAYAAPLDAVLRPQRPIPAGQIGRGTALAGGYAALAAFVVVAAGLALKGGPRAAAAAGGLALLLAGTALLYDTASEGNPAAPALLALCRGLAYLTAAAVVSGRVSGPPALAAAALAAYATGLYCCCDREGGGPRLWPLLLLLVPFLAAAPLLSGEPAQAVLWFCALAWVTRALLRLLQRDFERASIELFSAMPLMDALMISQRHPGAAVWLAAAAFPLTYILLRWLPED